MDVVLTRHHDVLAALHAPEQFSNNVSAHLNVPNGMDGAEHRTYRALIEPFFSAAVLTQFQPKLQVVIDELFNSIASHNIVEISDTIGHQFALRAQCAFMGWPVTVQQRLTEWIAAQQAASVAQDRPALRALAAEFSDIVIAQLENARHGKSDPQSVTAKLTQLRLNGEPLSDDYLVSVIRNWTVGELGTIAAAASSIVEFLAANPVVQKQLRMAPEHIDHAIDEVLRIAAPLPGNRRRTTCPVTLGEQHIDSDTLVRIDWRAANRDPQVFEQPEQFQWHRDLSLNLLYGAGIHVCPGKPLAQLELRLFTESLLARVPHIE